MKTFKYKEANGDEFEARLNKIDNALPLIKKRLELVVPVETVEFDAVKRAVASFNVNFERAITPAEAQTLVNALKVHILKEVDKAEKYYLDQNKKQIRKGETKNEDRKDKNGSKGK